MTCRGSSITRTDPGAWRRLILIEGMIGSGKSTTTERLAEKLIESGAPARAFNEGADDHPVRARSVDRLLGREEGPPGAYAVEQWNALADRGTHETGTTIVESTFLQNTVMPHFVDGARFTVDEVRHHRVRRCRRAPRPCGAAPRVSPTE